MYLSYEQVAKELGVSIATVKKLAADGRLRAHKIPGSRIVRFCSDEIDDAIKKF